MTSEVIHPKHDHNLTRLMLTTVTLKNRLEVFWFHRCTDNCKLFEKGALNSACLLKEKIEGTVSFN